MLHRRKGGCVSVPSTDIPKKKTKKKNRDRIVTNTFNIQHLPKWTHDSCLNSNIEGIWMFRGKFLAYPGQLHWQLWGGKQRKITLSSVSLYSTSSLDIIFSLAVIVAMLTHSGMCWRSKSLMVACHVMSLMVRSQNFVQSSSELIKTAICTIESTPIHSNALLLYLFWWPLSLMRWLQISILP